MLASPRQPGTACGRCADSLAALLLLPSACAVNLAVALSQRLGLRVGLLDADVYGPSIPRMMHLSGKPRVDAGG